MKKIIAFTLLLFCAAALFAEGEESQPFTLTVKTDLSLCLVTAYVVPEVSFFWQPGLLGVGADVRSLFGLSDGDVYGLACVEAKLGWFYIGGGICIPLSSGASSSLYSSDVTPAVSLGFDFPIITLGPGKLGINAGMDYIITWDTLTTENNIFAALTGAIWSVTYGAVKADLGLTYSIPL